MYPTNPSLRVTAFALAVLAAALAVLGCRHRDEPRALDAAPPPVDAAPPPIDAAPPPIDAAAKPAPTPTRLVASDDTTCAIMSDHTVRCWGGNAHGQLGNGDTADSAALVAPDIRAVVDLQLADATACALLDDASVACWGRIAWHGRAEDLRRPTGVLGVIGVKQIFVFPGRACARVANDSLVCWGNIDARGHFAAGATNRVPTPVVGLDHVATMLPDGALSDDGRIWRFAGDGAPRRLDVTGALEIAGRDGTVCGRLDGGRVVCADTGRCGSPPAPPAPPAKAPPAKAPPAKAPPPPKPPPPKPSKAAAAAPAGKVAAGKSAAGKSAAASAGKPAAASAGKPAAASAGKPAAASAGKPAAASAGKPAAASAGKPAAASAGKPAAAPAGKPAAASAGEPVLAIGFAPARQLAFDVGFCVVTTNGRLQCGDGCRKLDPIALERVDTITGRCALLKAGTVSCFDGAKFVAVPAAQHPTQLAVGRAHACAVVEGAIVCWGDDAHHQLGQFAVPP